MRRGYFVEHLGGSQFALPGAVDRLRVDAPGGRALDADEDGPHRPRTVGRRSPRPTPRTRTAPRSPWPDPVRDAGRDAGAAAPARVARPARSSCSSTARSCSTSSAAGAPCCRSRADTRRAGRRGRGRSRRPPGPGAPGGSRSSGSTASTCSTARCTAPLGAGARRRRVRGHPARPAPAGPVVTAAPCLRVTSCGGPPTALELALAGRTLVRSDLRWPTAATVDLVGRTVLETASYGKHLLTRFDDGRTLHTHLRMDGYWRVARTGTAAAAARSPARPGGAGDGRLDGGRAPPRACSTWCAPATSTRSIGHLGPDVLADDVRRRTQRRCAGGRPAGRRRWRRCCSTRRSSPGIGTIYTAESLFARAALAVDARPTRSRDPARLLHGRAPAACARSVASTARAARARARPGRASRAIAAAPRSRSGRRAGHRWSDRSSTARAARRPRLTRSTAGTRNGPRTGVHGPCR